MLKAVIDRVVDGDKVVLLVGNEETELVLGKEQLPEGAKEGMWVTVSLEGDKVKSITIDHGHSLHDRDRIEAKMNLLKKRGSRLK
ncbi:MAG: DUF3006 domain-containing protein [Bacillaceae bacterium]|nr:DUF3006 domain-containing protein [Bacillaceae bacterium]